MQQIKDGKLKHKKLAEEMIKLQKII